YSVADAYLRFWLAFLGPALPEIERGRGDLVLERIRTEWPRYLGRAIEPIVREAVTRMLPDERFGDARFCGTYWTRTGDVEVDLIGGTASPRPNESRSPAPSSGVTGSPSTAVTW